MAIELSRVIQEGARDWIDVETVMFRRDDDRLSVADRSNQAQQGILGRALSFDMLQNENRHKRM